MQNSCTQKAMYEPVAIHDKKDAPALAALEAQCFSSGWSVKQYEAVLTDSNYLIFALCDEKNIRAYVVAYHVQDELEILNIGTAPEYRRMGCAARLIRHLQENVCPRYAIRRIILDVRPSNKPALALYTRFNFVEAGRRRRYYAPDGEDALFLEWLRPQ